MAAPKGNCNNPNGRPRKSQALTDALKVELNKTLSFEGKPQSGKKVLAKMVTRAVTTGRMQFPEDNEVSIISIKDWLEFVKWVYERTDGKPVQPISGDEERGPIIIELIKDAEDTIT